MRLELQGLCRQYDGRGGVTDASLAVPRGAVYALLGANGSGKTTSMRVLSGLLFARQGTLRIDGEPIALDRWVRRPGLGFVPDEPILDLQLTAWQWASYVASLKGCGRQEDAEAAAEVLDLPAPMLDEPIGALSFGNRRKVALWIEFTTTAAVLIMDEPLIGLDPRAIAGFHEMTKRFVANGRSLLISTHLLHEAEAFATHVGILREGVTVRQGRLEELRDKGQTLLSAFLDAAS